MKIRKMLSRATVLTVAVLFIAGPALAGNLVAKKTNKAPKIDGKVDSVWSKIRSTKIMVEEGKPGKVKVSMKAMYDDQFVYFLIQWADKTMSQNRVYEFKGGQWKKRKGNEDRFGILFNNNIPDFPKSGCESACHGEGTYMGTEKAGATGDIWHWKAQRTNPLGYADDQSIQDKVKIKGHEKTARKSDKRSGGSYKANFDKNKKQPKFIGAGMGGPVLLKAVAKPFKGGAKEGTIAPREVLARPVGSRGDIDAKGVWKNGRWTLELRRKLDTGNKDDIAFKPGGSTLFGIAVFDNGGGVKHSYQKGVTKLILKKSGSN